MEMYRKFVKDVFEVKKVFILITLVGCLILNSNFCYAKDVWIYNYPNGNNLYIVYESVVYGVRTGFYAYFRVKHVNDAGNLIKTEKWEMNHDEGDWWYGIYSPYNGKRIEKSRRIYDYEDSTAVLNWLKEHRHEAKNTSRPYEKVLSD